MSKRSLRSKQKYPPEVGDSIKIKNIIKPRTYSQELYLESLRSAPLTIGNGPAGCGKTYLVTAIALEKLLAREVEKIVVTRPVVEAGENLGFLPGTLEEKLDPYLRPIFDAIEDHVGIQKLKWLLENGRLEIAPLAFMRGRTFNRAFVILDEAQNCTVPQVRMFVTRMGMYSYFSVNGDDSQPDLPKHQKNGLQWIISKLRGVDPAVNVVDFSISDVQRSEVLKRLLPYLESGEDER